MVIKKKEGINEEISENNNVKKRINNDLRKIQSVTHFLFFHLPSNNQSKK